MKLTLEVVIMIWASVVLPLLGLLVKLVLNIGNKKIDEIQKRNDNTDLNRLIDRVQDAISTAVISTAGTYVDKLKADGKFDTEAQKKAFNDAKDKALSMLSIGAQEAIKQEYGSLDSYIEHKIEFFVKATK